jgi:hypothetical protein
MLLLLLLGPGLPGCDIPTQAPEWDTRWIVPGRTIGIAVDDFLPAGVEVAPGGDAFRVRAVRGTIEMVLADLCPPCVPLDGTVAPKPAFAGAVHTVVQLPDDIVMVEIAQGRARVLVSHEFDFDPLRPGGPETGTLRLTLLDDATDRVLASTTVRGEDQGFSPGAAGALEEELELEPGPVSPALRLLVELHSPAGEPVPIDASRGFHVSVEIGPILVSSAQVLTVGREVDLEPTSLEVEGVDEVLVERIQSGGVHLDVTNPFGVGLVGTLRIDGPDFSAIQRAFTLPAGPASRVSVELSGEELRSFLGRAGVTVSGGATVTEDPPTATLRPGQEVEVRVRLDATVRVGG